MSSGRMEVQMRERDSTELEIRGTLLTVQELAKLLRLKPSWVYGHADELGAYRLGKYLRFSWPKVLQQLERTVGVSAQRRSLTSTQGHTSDDRGTD